MLIDCDTCAVRDVHCGDCVINLFLTLPGRAGPTARTGRAGPPAAHVGSPGPRVELDDPEREALRSLVAAGLVPPLRLVAMSAPPDPDRGIA